MKFRVLAVESYQRDVCLGKNIHFANPVTEGRSAEYTSGLVLHPGNLDHTIFNQKKFRPDFTLFQNSVAFTVVQQPLINFPAAEPLPGPTGIFCCFA